MDEGTKDPLMRTDLRELITERRSDVIPVYEGDHSRLVIDVVHVQVRVIGVVDYKRTTEAVAVLRRNVRVVPVRASLVRGVEVVQERVASGNRALVDESGTIGPVGVLLEQAVPMLGVERLLMRGYGA